MQSPGITLSFHGEMANSSRELVGPDVSAAVTFERYPRFIKGGFQDYEGSRDQKIHCLFQACSLRTIEVARKRGLLKLPPESSRMFGITWRFGRSFQIEATERRRELGELLDQRSNQPQEFLLLWPIAGCDEEGSELNVGHLAARRKIRLMPDEYPTSTGVVSEQPPVPISTAVNLSSPNGHATILRRSHRYQC
jgi:hypothetical protein